MKRFELDEKPELKQPKLKQSIFSRLQRRFKKTPPVIPAPKVPEPQKPVDKPKTQLQVSKEVVSVKPQPVVQPPKKRDYHIVNMTIGGFALMVLSYGAIMINQAFTPNTTIVASILMVSIAASILINIIRSF